MAVDYEGRMRAVEDAVIATGTVRLARARASTAASAPTAAASQP